MAASVLPNAITLNSFKRLEFVAQKVVEGLVTGLHKSPSKGFALEFEEHRMYVPGDDIKHLDWKILGKKDRYYVKLYEEETSLRAYLVVDRSGSMAYGSNGVSKLDLARHVAGVLSYLLMHQKDAVSLVTFDARVRTYLPPRRTKTHLKAIMDTLAAVEPGADTGLGDVLHYLANRIRRRGLMVIISDLFDSAADIALALNHFAHKKHEVVVFQVLDRREEEFPFSDPTRFVSLEGDETERTDPIRLRREYRRQFRLHQEQVRGACHDLHIDFVPIYTDEPVAASLARYLCGRLRR